MVSFLLSRIAPKPLLLFRFNISISTQAGTGKKQNHVKGQSSIKFFANLISDKFFFKSNLFSINNAMLARLYNLLFSFSEIIGQTIKLFFTESSQNSVKKRSK